MNNFKHYLMLNEALKRFGTVPVDQRPTMKELRKRQKSKKTCSNCKMESVWRLVGTGLCFSCTTGEVDASNDYELEPI